MAEQNHLVALSDRRLALTVAGQWRSLTALPLLLLRFMVVVAQAIPTARSLVHPHCMPDA